MKQLPHNRTLIAFVKWGILLFLLVLLAPSVSLAQDSTTLVKPGLGKGKRPVPSTMDTLPPGPKISIGKGKDKSQTPVLTPTPTKEKSKKEAKAPKQPKEPKGKVAKKIFDREVKHAPLKAVLLSAIVPGSGQAFNRRYWKIPLVWGALGTAGYFIGTNTRYHKNYKKAYLFRVDGDPFTVDPYEGLYSESDLRTLRDSYRKNQELSYIAFFALYFLTGVDAFVDAHLSTFDISEDLSLRIAPQFMPPAFGDQPVLGVGVSLFGRNGGKEIPKELF